MIRRGDSIRRASSAAVAVLTLSLSVAIPALERGSFDGLAVESHHDPAKCTPGHDHRLCAQLGPTLLVAPVESELAEDSLLDVSPPAAEPFAHGNAAPAGTRSRAPPQR